MNGFDIMAETKMRQWEQDKKDGKVEPKAERQITCTASGESLEKQLYADIKRLIRRSFEEAPRERHESLMEAERIQVQLSARLEKNGHYHLVKYFSDEIRKLRATIQ